MRHLARAVVGHPWLVVLAWVAGIAAISLFGPSYGSAPHSSLGLPATTRSARADALARAHFGGDDRPTATVVTEDPAGAGALRRWLASAPDVVQVGPAVPSSDGQAALLSITFSRGGNDLDRAIATIEAHLAGGPAAITGSAVVDHDFNAAALGSSTGAAGQSPLRIVTLLIVLVVLALVYRAPLAVAVPLVCVGAAVLVGPHLVGGLGALTGLPVSDFSLLFMFTVTLGAGTNYGLFLISRYREMLTAGLAPRPALEEALTQVGEAIASSAATVALATALMAFASFDLFRTLGPAVAVAVVTMLAAGLTLLPALIAICGRAFFWPRRPAAPTQPAERGAWRRIGDLVVRHPAWLAAACTALLLPAAATALTIRPSFDLEGSLPATSQSARAAALLSRHFPTLASAVTLLVQPPADPSAVRASVGAVPGVSSVSAPETSPDGAVQRYHVGLRDAAGSQAAIDTVAAIDRAVPSGHGLATGQAAAGRDFQDLLGHDFLLVAALAAASIYLILALLLRSPLTPLYLLATVGLSAATAIGLTAMISEHLLGQPLFWTAPVFGFVFLVALGEDFNIFLMSRLRHEVGEHGRSEGIARAVGATGGVVTSCGLVMASAFLLLARSDLAVARQIGLVVVIGVLLDTFLVRPVLVPALASLLRTGPRPARSRAASRTAGAVR